jgi:hypothetical protein
MASSITTVASSNNPPRKRLGSTSPRELGSERPYQRNSREGKAQSPQATKTKTATTIATNATATRSPYTKQPRTGSLTYQDPKKSLHVMADLIKELTAALQDRDEQITILKSNRNQKDKIQEITSNDNNDDDYNDDDNKSEQTNRGTNDQQLEQIRHERDMARVKASELAVRLAECQAQLDVYMDQEKLYQEIGLDKAISITTKGKSTSTTEISTVRLFRWMFGSSKNDSHLSTSSQNDDNALPNLQEDWSSSSSLSSSFSSDSS